MHTMNSTTSRPRPNSWHQRVKSPWMRDLFRPIEEQELVMGQTNRIQHMNKGGQSTEDIFETCTDGKLQPIAIPVEKLPANILGILEITHEIEAVQRHVRSIIFCPILRYSGAFIPNPAEKNMYPNVIGGLAPNTALRETILKDESKQSFFIKSGDFDGKALSPTPEIALCEIIVHETRHLQIEQLVATGKLHPSHQHDSRASEQSAHERQREFLVKIQRRADKVGIWGKKMQYIEDRLQRVRAHLQALEIMIDQGLLPTDEQCS